jgi:ribosomal protein S18 acetylase RimI-like enzyme
MSLPCVQELGDNLLNIYTIYNASFDEDIRVPWPAIVNKLTGRSCTHLFTHEGTPSGFVIWTPHPSNQSVFIDYFCVSPHVQGLGLGRKYFTWIVDCLSSQYTYILLDCKSNVVRFYQLFGFRAIHQTLFGTTTLTVMVSPQNTDTDDALVSYQAFCGP